MRKAVLASAGNVLEVVGTCDRGMVATLYRVEVGMVLGIMERYGDSWLSLQPPVTSSDTILTDQSLSHCHPHPQATVTSPGALSEPWTPSA